MDAMPVLAYLPLLWSVAATPSAKPLARPAAELKSMTACLAVSRSEIEQALGQPVGTGKERRDRATSSCEYETAAGQVTVAIYRSISKLNLAAEVKHLKKAIPEAKIRDAQGLGSRAFFMDMGAIGTQLHVVRGDFDYVLVSILGFGGATQVSDAAEKIARRALDRF